MQLFCPDCGTRIAAENIHLDSLLAKCVDCDSVFSFATAIEEEPARRRRDAPQRGEQEVIARPRGLVVADDGVNLSIRRSWLTPGAIFLLFFTIAWDAFLIFWYSIAFTQKVPWIMIVFPVAHVAIGAGLTYFVIACFVNRTWISLDGGRLSVRHRPLPWPGNVEIDSSEIDQLYCKRDVHHGSKGGTTVNYSLHAVLKGGRKQQLLSGVDEDDHVRFLEQQIEQRLGLADRRVRGEMRD